MHNNLFKLLTLINFFSVITGARFVKKNNIMYIQVQEGKLLPNGIIDPDTVTWVPIPKNPHSKNNFLAI